MLVSHYDLLTETEGQLWTLATAVERPIAIVIPGGLITSAAPSPLVLLGCALRFRRFDAQGRPA